MLYQILMVSAMSARKNLSFLSISRPSLLFYLDANRMPCVDPVRVCLDCWPRRWVRLVQQTSAHPLLPCSRQETLVSEDDAGRRLVYCPLNDEKVPVQETSLVSQLEPGHPGPLTLI